jgi:hypothetical protein
VSGAYAKITIHKVIVKKIKGLKNNLHYSDFRHAFNTSNMKAIQNTYAK